MKTTLERNRKAIVAALTPAVAYLAVKAGLSLDDTEAAGIAAFATALIVWATPNSYGKG